MSQNSISSITDTTLPDGAWKFDEGVAAAFDDMLRRSIPQYDVMRKAVTALAQMYLPGTVIDLGCSRGEAIAQLYSPDSLFLGIEISQPMLEAARERFTGLTNVAIHALDLRTYYPDIEADITLSILTLQFIPIEYRQRILKNIFQHTRPGGAFILVEKVLGATADVDGQMVRNYYNLKGENGYTNEQIQRKRLSLEGVLVPVTARWNEELLRSAGFWHVDCFWRWMNFAGWIAIKNE